MRSLLSFLLTFLSLLYLASSDPRDCANYYWRDYYGPIPYDAVPAGRDHKGDFNYVGLVYIPGYEYLPATILPEFGIARTTAYKQVLDTTQQIKILCSPFKTAFEWTLIQSKDLREYTKRILIPGGSEVGENLWIGRVFRDNDAIIGKIFRHELSNRGIWYPQGDHPANYLTYEILSYNCKKAICCEFDIRTGEKNE